MRDMIGTARVRAVFVFSARSTIASGRTSEQRSDNSSPIRQPVSSSAKMTSRKCGCASASSRASSSPTSRLSLPLGPSALTVTASPFRLNGVTARTAKNNSSSVLQQRRPVHHHIVGLVIVLHGSVHRKRCPSPVTVYWLYRDQRGGESGTALQGLTSPAARRL